MRENGYEAKQARKLYTRFGDWIATHYDSAPSATQWCSIMEEEAPSSNEDDNTLNSHQSCGHTLPGSSQEYSPGDTTPRESPLL